ncbi:ComEC/Rec2 family competence protein [Streptomyces sp. WAC05374]|uniref:ComEC/Rec2 family competence protein n=1 Tax=Streptomyces sp. WAC05374 TaxID=2487420 RepID=UPI001054869B|nr:ComEC/Rec2 family competence protein [Streptomyces sp. WAC05374]TDF45325.1 ComEC/Rec2 family competence protein [Streptomyces sp. WAC05374]TDF55687.1 ComEC/Rec2 family competence protein [Streptomyces sp. WAC05374]TDF58825.1 ComEC/Rec2 family competence protein [Streptomyces sp. WAC05374]
MRGTVVHTASGTPPGAADPRREGPADLRLVGPALAAWGAAALALGAPGGWTATGVTLCLAGGLVLLLGRGGAGARARSRGNGTAVAAVLLCAAAGAASAGLHGADLRRGPLPGLAERHGRVTAEATVTSDPRLTHAKVRGPRAVPVSVVLNAEVTRVTASDGTASRVRTPVLVVVSPGGADWRLLLPSTRLRLTGRLAPPQSPGDPFAAVLRVDAGPPRVIGPPTPLQRAAGGLRAGLREATEGLAPDARALLPGLVVGDTSRIPPDLHDAFRATDLTHLLAVSGSNLTIVLLLLIGPPGSALKAERGGLAPRLGIPLRATALLGGALTLAFVLVCRPDPSVLRAAACGLITLLAIGTGRRRSLIPALAAAVLLLVLYDPWLACSYGFLLSVLATGALLTVAPRWSASLRRRRVPPRIAEALAATAAAQAVCAPVVAVFAARVGLVAIPCNLLAELAVAPATVLGFAALATAPLAMPVAGLLARCAGWPAGWIASVAREGAALPGAEVQWPGGWAGGLLLAAVTGVAVVWVRRVRHRAWLAGVCTVLLLLAVVRPPPLTRLLTGWPPPGWVFAMCDVGQGDATVLAAGRDTAVVVDAGPDPVPVDRCLRDLGVSRVPLVVLTHFHADHVTGLPGVLRGRAVGAIQTTSLQEPADQAAFVRRTAAAAGVPVVVAGAGERRRIGPLDWRVLWPGAVGAGPAPEGANDASVTLLVRAAGGTTLLLLGDLEPPAQQGLLRAHPDLSRVDVLKVAHHGSAHQDPRLLSRAGPRLALVSAGRDNPYGHPSPRTVHALRAGGAVVLSTDRHGAIAVTGRGEELRAGTALGAGPGP